MICRINNLFGTFVRDKKKGVKGFHSQALSNLLNRQTPLRKYVTFIIGQGYVEGRGIVTF